jgi:hypothetical protein
MMNIAAAQWEWGVKLTTDHAVAKFLAYLLFPCEKSTASGYNESTGYGVAVHTRVTNRNVGERTNVCC